MKNVNNDFKQSKDMVSNVILCFMPGPTSSIHFLDLLGNGISLT